MLKHMTDNLDIFICPACGGSLKIVNDEINCRGCQERYQADCGIPLLFCPNDWVPLKKDVTNIIKSFYERTPFPNYEDFENVGDLIEKAQRGIFARLLNEQIPLNIRVLEVGCGTGQLSNFLGVANRSVFGADICLNSLKLACDFKNKNGLERVGFYQMNLFKPIFKEGSFPLVICNGVLHHTSDPFAGFRSIAKLVKSKGYIIIGLYNRYGRIITDIRRIIFKIFGDNLSFLDPRLRKNNIGNLRKLTWFMDQYKNPHESKHTFAEVLTWSERTGFDFVNGIPKLKAFEIFSDNEKLFRVNPRGNWLDHFLVQSRLMFTGSKEGGFFLMIGRKRA